MKRSNNPKKIGDATVYEALLLLIIGLVAVDLLTDFVRSFAYETLNLKQTRTLDTLLVFVTFMIIFIALIMIFGVGLEYKVALA